MNAAMPKEFDVRLAGLGLRTRVIEVGTGPVVLMLHGNPDNADEWRPLMARLGQRYRCIAPDFPGYGKSPEPPASFSYSLADQIRFLDALLETLLVASPVVLVVHDTGGMVGTAWAAANIPRLVGIIVTNTVAFEGFRWFKIARTWGGRSMIARWRAALGMRLIGLGRGALFKRIFGAQSPQLGVDDLNRFASSFALNQAAKNASLRQFRQCVEPTFFVGFDAMWVTLSQSVPCRVLWGDGDPYVPTKCARRFGSAHVTILPGVGHWVPLIAPDQLAAEVDALR